MQIALWIINGLLALLFLVTGAFKLVKSKEGLVGAGMGWAGDFPQWFAKLIGLFEVLGAIGLIVPLATNIAPILTPIAAIGLAIIMVGATVVHARRKETPIPTIVLTVLSIVSAVLGFSIVLG